MKPIQNYLLATIIIACAITIDAVAPKLLYCEKAGDQTECVYQVTGENISHPQEPSMLYRLKNVPFALCSKAKCKKINSKTAHCICHTYGLKGDDKRERISVGPQNLKATQPARAKDGKLKTVISNFSLANIKHGQKIPHTTCRFKKPTGWANCYGASCKVQYGNGRPKAICECPIVKTKIFTSIGPKNTGQCRTKSDEIWSAATIGQDKNNKAIVGHTPCF